MLTELDINILKGLYELKFNIGENLNYQELGFENNQHAAYHLYKLQNLGFIDFDEQALFSTGGMKNEKYNNNVLIIYKNDGVELLEKGIEEAKKYL